MPDGSSRILAVTGAGGFTGRRIVRRALRDGWRVRALVRRPERTSWSDSRVETLRCDITVADEVEAGLLGVYAVVHAAAYIPPDLRSPEFAAECVRVNQLGTLCLLEAVASAGISRFVLLAAGNAYRRHGGAAAEDDALYPSEFATFYLMSKVVSEVYVEHYRHVHALSTCVLRISSIYGPGMGARGLIPSFAARLSRGEPVQLANAGRYQVDLVHVDDVAWACVAAADRSESAILNIGSGTHTSVLEVARTLLSLTGAPETLLDIAPPDDAAPRGFSALTIAEAQRVLGFSATPLRAGLEQYLQDRSGQPPPWQHADPTA
jgi:UDP-glucose 4-epimerase